MIQVILTGTSGAMGKHLIEQIQMSDHMTISAGIDRQLVSDCPFPQYVCFDKASVTGDVIIDFSHPSLLEDLLTFAKSKQIPTIICTTGLEAAHHAAIEEASKKDSNFPLRQHVLRRQPHDPSCQSGCCRPR